MTYVYKLDNNLPQYDEWLSVKITKRECKFNIRLYLEFSEDIDETQVIAKIGIANFGAGITGDCEDIKVNRDDQFVTLDVEVLYAFCFDI